MKRPLGGEEIASLYGRGSRDASSFCALSSRFAEHDQELCVQNNAPGHEQTEGKGSLGDEVTSPNRTPKQRMTHFELSLKPPDARIKDRDGKEKCSVMYDETKPVLDGEAVASRNDSHTLVTTLSFPPLLSEYNETEEDKEEECDSKGNSGSCFSDVPQGQEHQKTLDVTWKESGAKPAEKSGKTGPFTPPAMPIDYTAMFQNLLQQLHLIREVSKKYQREKEILQEAQIDPEALRERVRSKYQKRLNSSKGNK